MPNGDLVSFPNDMPDDDIRGFISGHFPDAFAPPKTESPFSESFTEAVGPLNLEALAGIASQAKSLPFETGDETLQSARESLLQTAEGMRSENTPTNRRVDTLQKVWDGIGTDQNMLERGSEWFKRAAGSGLGSIAAPVAGGVIGGVAGAASPVPGGAAIGTAAGTIGASYLQNAGLLQNELLNLGVDEDTAAKWSAPTGIGMAALDRIVPARVLSNLSAEAKRETIRNAAKEIAKQIASGAKTEAVTEGLQESLSMGAELGAAGKDPFTSEGAMRVIESAAQGAVGGGIAEGVSSIPQYMKPMRGQDTEPPVPTPVDAVGTPPVEPPPAAGAATGIDDLFSGFEGLTVDLPNAGEREIISVTPQGTVLENPETGERETMPTGEAFTYIDPENADKVRQLLAAQKTAEPARQQETFPVFTPSGSKIDTKPVVVEADSLITSNDPMGNPNPDYPSALQPRDRTRATSQQQIQTIAARLNPELLGITATAGEGAPIVGEDMVVESGNGRVQAIKQAYGAYPESSQKYRDYLSSQGYNIEGMKNPVLVRQRITPLDEKGRAQFTSEANASNVMSMSATEKAISDANIITGDMLGMFAGSDPTLQQNGDFVRNFIEKLPETERGAMIGPDKKLSIQGKRRIEAALLARAYKDPDLITKLAESADNDIKSIGSALQENAAKWGMLRDAAKEGVVARELDVTDDLLSAIRIVEESRQSGKPVGQIVQEAKTDMFGGKEITPAAENILRMMYRGEDFTKPNAAKKLSESLNNYLESALRTANAAGDMLGGGETTPQQILLRIAGTQKPTEATKATVEPKSEPKKAVNAAPHIGTGKAVGVGKFSGSKYTKVLQEWMDMLGMSDNGIMLIDSTTVNGFKKGDKGRELAWAFDEKYGLPRGTGRSLTSIAGGTNGYFAEQLQNGFKLNIIVLKNGMSEPKTLEVLAHEMGHAFEVAYFNAQPAEIQKAVRDAHAQYEKEISKGKIGDLRERKWPKEKSEALPESFAQTGFKEGFKPKKQKYEKSFTEWYADQTARYFNTQKAPLDVVGKFFYDLAQKLKNFYAKIAGSEKYLPDASIKSLYDGAIRAAKNAPIIEMNKNVDVEKTPAGQQSVIPGAERISDKQLAERKMQQPLRSDKKQKPMDDGLFSSDAQQIDLFMDEDPNALPEAMEQSYQQQATEAFKGVPEQRRDDFELKQIKETTRTMRDLGWAAWVFKPIQNAKMSRLLAPLYAVTKMQRAEAARLSQDAAQALYPAYELPAKSLKKVGDYMYSSIGDRRIERAEKEGNYGNLNAAEIKAVQSLRKFFDSVVPTIKKAAARNAGIENVDSKTDKQILEELLARQEVEQNPVVQMRINKAVQVMEGFKKVVNYYPDIRTGDMWINVRDAEGKVVFNDQVQSDSIAGKLKGILSSEPGRNFEEALKYVRKEYPPTKGFVITSGNVNMKKNPANLGLDPATIQRLFNAAMKAEGTTDQQVVFDAIDAMIQQLNLFKTPAFMKNRKKVARLPDIPHGDILMTYANIASHLPARMAYQGDFDDAAMAIANRGMPREREIAARYIENLRSAQESFYGNVRAWTFYTAFALKLPTPLANYFSVYVVGGSDLSKYTGLSSYSKIAALTKTVASATGWDPEHGVVFKIDKLKGKIPANEFKYLKDSAEILAYNYLDFTNSENLKTVRGRLAQSAYEKYERVARILSSGMGVTEQSARVQLGLASYRAFKSDAKAREKFMRMNGKNPLYIELASRRGGVGSPESMADWSIQESFFDSTKLNQAEWERGFLSVISQFKSYPYQLVSKIITDMHEGFVKGDAAAAQAALLTLGMTVALGGLAALPFMDDVERLWKAFDKDTDFKTAWRELLTNDLGMSPYAVDATVSGALSPAGIGIGNQFSLASLLPNSLSLADMAGPGVALTLGRIGAGAERARSGQELGAAAEYIGAVPGVGNLARNITMAGLVYPEEGIQTRKGQPVIAADKVTAGQRISQAFGMQPPSVQKKYQEIEAIKTKDEAGRTAQSEFHNTVANLLARKRLAKLQGRDDEALEYQREINELYKEVRALPKEERFTPNHQAIKRKYEALIRPDDARIKKMRKDTRQEGREIQKLYGN